MSFQLLGLKISVRKGKYQVCASFIVLRVYFPIASLRTVLLLFQNMYNTITIKCSLRAESSDIYTNILIFKMFSVGVSFTNASVVV